MHWKPMMAPMEKGGRQGVRYKPEGAGLRAPAVPEESGGTRMELRNRSGRRNSGLPLPLLS